LEKGAAWLLKLKRIDYGVISPHRPSRSSPFGCLAHFRAEPVKVVRQEMGKGVGVSKKLPF